MQGNDAGYTVEALIGISVKALTYEHPEAPDPERLSAAAAEAQARIIQDVEEWEIADEEGGDGGSAVKLLPGAEMAQARAFQQGLNRALKAEDKQTQKHARSDARNRQRGDHRGGKGTTNGHDEDYPALKPSIERKDEIKHHAANEQKMREKAAPTLDSDDDGLDWGWIPDPNGKEAAAAGQNDGADESTTDHNDNNNNNPINQHHQPKRDPDYIPPHKRAIQKLTLKEPKKHNAQDDNNDVGKNDLIDLQDKREQPPPPPPQRLMDRMKLLDAYEDDGDGSVALI